MGKKTNFLPRRGNGVLYLIAFSILSLLGSVSTSATDYYLSSVSGSNNNVGTSSGQAWESFSKLKSVLNSLNSGDNVYLERGSVWHEVDISLNNVHATESSPIVFQAYGSGSIPVLKGSTLYSAGTNWTQHAGNIYRLNISDSPEYVRYLKINGAKQYVGRYPKEGWLHKTSAAASNRFGDANLDFPNDHWNGATVNVRTVEWILEARKVSDYSQSGGSFTLSEDLEYEPQVGWGYFIQNHVNCLTTQGEWAYNESSHDIYLYSNTNPNTLNIEIATVSNIVQLTNCSNIHFSGLRFEMANQEGILVTQSDHIEVLSSQFEDLERASRFFSCSNVKFNNNLVDNISATGVEFRGCDGGEVNDNKVNNIGMVVGEGNQTWGMRGIAMSVDWSNQLSAYVDSRNFDVLRNEVNNVGYNGIDFSRTANINIQFNKITNYCWHLDDGGGIYTWHNREGPLGTQYVQNHRACNIKNNYLRADNTNENTLASKSDSPEHQYAVFGIYIDDNSDSVNIENNMVLNNGGNLFIHNSRAINIIDNITANSGHSELIFRYNAGLEFMTNCRFEGNIMAALNPSDQSEGRWTFYNMYADELGYSTGSGSSTQLQTSGMDWSSNEFTGLRVWNTTDASSGIITSNAANSLICSGGLSGGTTNQWRNDDVFAVQTNVYDKNYHLNLSNPAADIIYSMPYALDESGTYDIQEWISYQGGINEKGEPFKFGESGLTNRNEFIFTDFNFSNTPRSVTLSGAYTYWDVDGNYVTSAVLQPYSGILLLRKQGFGAPSNNPPSVNNGEFNIEANDGPPYIIGSVNASDSDAGQSLSYSIVAGNSTNTFLVNSSSGQLNFVNSNPDFTNNPHYSLTVRVTDDGDPALYTDASIEIQLLGNSVSNQAPTILNQQFPVQEENGPPYTIGTIAASDPDPGQSLTYAIVSGNDQVFFSLNPSNGVLAFTSSDPDFTGNPEYQLQVRVSDDGDPQQYDEALITVKLIAIVENNPPTVVAQEFNVYEENGAPYELGSVEAYDADEDQTLVYSIVSGNSNAAFAIGSTSGLLEFTSSQPIFEGSPKYSLTIEVRDNGTPQASNQATVSINLFETPDNHPPVIVEQSFIVPEEGGGAYEIGTIIASDSDEEQSLNYEIISGNEENVLELNERTGVLSFTQVSPLFAGNPVYELLVRVQDDGSPQESDQAIVSVHLIGIEENNSPSLSNQSFIIYESENIEHYIGMVLASDPDENQSLTYEITGGNSEGLFELTDNSGELYFTRVDFDFFQSMDFDLEVTVSDNGADQLSANGIVTVSLISNSKVYYIDPGSSSKTQTGSREHPYSSWSTVRWEEDAHYLQRRGTVAEEEMITITTSDVTLGAYDQGELPRISSQSEIHAVRLIGVSGVTIKELQIEGNQAISCIYSIGNQASENTIESCCLIGADFGVRILAGEDFYIRFNMFKEQLKGISTYARNSKIHYNIFKGSNEAIALGASNTHDRIYNNVFDNNRLAIKAAKGEVTAYNNIFSLEQSDDIAIEQETKNLISNYNLFYPVRTGFVSLANEKYNMLAELRESGGKAMNSLSDNPSFVDPENDNYSVEGSSVVIDAGKDLGLLKDYIGFDVPFGNAPDIGALEFSKFSSELGVGFNSVSKQIDVFPNPTSGVFTFKVLDTESLQQLEIVNLNGSTVYIESYSENSSQSSDDIDISGFSNGIYVVRFIFDQNVVSKKLVKK